MPVCMQHSRDLPENIILQCCCTNCMNAVAKLYNILKFIFGYFGKHDQGSTQGRTNASFAEFDFSSFDMTPDD